MSAISGKNISRAKVRPSLSYLKEPFRKSQISVRRENASQDKKITVQLYILMCVITCARDDNENIGEDAWEMAVILFRAFFLIDCWDNFSHVSLRSFKIFLLFQTLYEWKVLSLVCYFAAKSLSQFQKREKCFKADLSSAEVIKKDFLRRFLRN